MKFKRTTAVNKILRMLKRIKIVQGGMRAGKTFAIMAILIDRAFKQKGFIIDVVGQTRSHLERGAVEDFQFIMKETGRWEDDRWNMSKFVYTFKNGTKIRFMAIDKIGKAKGPKRDILYINEANYIHFNIAEQLMDRTVQDIYIDYNPTHKFWAHKMQEERDDCDFQIITYKDNEACPKQIVKNLKLKEKNKDLSDWHRNQYRVYVLGLLGKLEGTIFQNVEVVNNIPINARYIGSGIDYGYSVDPNAMVDIYIAGKNLYIDEVIYHKCDVTQLSELIGAYNSNLERVIYSEHNDWGINELRRNRLTVIKADKGKGSVNGGISKLQGFNIKITKRSKNVIKEYEEYKWKENINGESLPIPEDKNNHSIDATRYGISNILMEEDNDFNPYDY